MVHGSGPTKHRFYRAWVTVEPVGSAKSCRLKVNSDYKDATPANGSEERTAKERLGVKAKEGRAQGLGVVPLV
ncbi:hypothetical protein PIB30_096161 [Stylosanthes scabra]|uniref:Uncharacterized protein n=1 Tax=Stylosanthes scabra TaxID=79078 RepID=A0ABU6WYN0_9FABA|nr:hypothetical protein [Stylosanthes scabra]